MPITTQTLLEPGVYFGLPDAQYHALPYLSSTAIKHLLISPMDYWARSHMNPWKEEDEEESEAKTFGKAYHKRILEGPAAFNDAYAPKFECTDPDVLRTQDDLKKALKDYAQPVSGNKPDQIARLLSVWPDAPIYDIMEQEYKALHAGKELLDPKTIRKIELAAAMIANHPALKFYFVGGFAEVSVVWDDAELGLRCKARFDYLKVNAINDLKTFANMMNKTIEKAVYGAMASGRYHIQGAFYLRGVEEAKKLMKAGKWFAVDTLEGLAPEVPEEDWREAFMASSQHSFNFCFQQKGPAPVSVGAIFSPEDGMYETGIACIQQAADIYKANADHYGTDGTPWVDTRDPIMLHWQQYPAYASDI